MTEQQFEKLLKQRSRIFGDTERGYMTRAYLGVPDRLNRRRKKRELLKIFDEQKNAQS